MRDTLTKRTLRINPSGIIIVSVAAISCAYYQKRINQQDCLKDIVVRQNETTKSAIPAWILRDWANKFNMTFEN